MVGKVILVTGASTGLGAAIAIQAGRRSNAVYATMRDLKKVDAVAAAATAAGAKLSYLPLDVQDPKSVEAAVTEVIKREGRIDVLAGQRTRLHKTAKPDASTGLHLLLDDVRRRIEENDGVTQRGQHKRRRDCEHQPAHPDQDQTPLFAGHCAVTSSFNAKPFREIVKALLFVGVVADCVARASSRLACFFLVSHDGIGAHKAQPALEIRRIRLQPLGHPSAVSDLRHGVCAPSP